jgi:hypothetical protein
MPISQPTYDIRVDDLVTHVGAYADKITSEASVAATQTSSFTFSLGMKGQAVPASSASPIVATIPTNAAVPYPIGSWIELDRMGTGSVEFAASGGVPVIRNAAPVLTLRAQYSTAVARKIGTDEWLIVGDLG